MSRCRAATSAVLGLGLLALLSLASPAGAIDRPVIFAERAAADTVLVRESDIVEEDLYAGGNRVLIEGIVQGDLTVAAFRELVITGTVEGDVSGYSPLVQIDGTVTGSVRVAADVVRVQGEIGEDLFAGARTTAVTGTVGRDIQTWGLSLDVRGTVGRDIRGWVLDKFRLGGATGRDVDVRVGQLEVLDGTRIAGSLAYRSDSEAILGNGVDIDGVLTQRQPLNPNVRVQAIFALTTVLVVLAIVGLGFLLFRLAPRSLRRAVESVQSRTLISFATGLAVLVLPITLFVLLVVWLLDASPELALPSAVIGLPLGFLLVGLLLFGLLVSPVPVFTALGERITRGRSSVLFSYLVGMVLWVVILVVPVLRMLVSVLVAILGLGAWTIGLLGARGSPEWATRREGRAAGRRATGTRRPQWFDTGTREPGSELEAVVPFDGEMELPFDDPPGGR